MTLTLKQTEIGKHYICLEIDKVGVYRVTDSILFDECRCAEVSTYSSPNKKNAYATYNRYVKRYR